MTPDQRSAVARLIAATAGPEPFFAHHGDCIGADAEFHELCLAHPGAKILVHPGPLHDRARQAGCVGLERRESMPHMQRNANIVLASTVMIAAPWEDSERVHGGTWGTVRMARVAKRPLMIAYPSGSVVRWTP
jgi:hypothetical protein